MPGKRHGKIKVDSLIPTLQGDFVDWLSQIDARGIDQDIDITEGLIGIRRNRTQRFTVRKVSRQCSG